MTLSDDEIRRRFNPHIGVTMDEHSEGLGAMLERIVALEAEVERLREALRAADVICRKYEDEIYRKYEVVDYR